MNARPVLLPLYTLAASQLGSGPAELIDGSTIDACAAYSLSNYNLSFHIIGLFIILVASLVGTFATLLLGWSITERRSYAIQILKMFGIGVIAGSAWINLLPKAFAKFTSPCLQGYWTNYGGSYVGLFAMFAAFIAQLIEVGLMSNSHRHHLTTVPSDDTIKPDDLEIDLPAYQKSHDYIFESQISIVLLEAGIIFNSTVIGLNLGVEVDSGFTTLLIAFSFHQMFEGVALGALIVTTRLSKSSKIILGLMYPLTTLIGMIVGIAISNTMNIESQGFILFQGIIGSFSAGILMYNTYCELMSLEVNHNPTFKCFTRQFKIVCFISMYIGAGAIALLEIWT